TIDWNLSARSDRIYVRESHPDRGLDAWLIVDASASLDWGTALMLKREAAIDMASAASSLIARHGSRVGAIVFDANVRRILPPVDPETGRQLHVDTSDRRLRERFQLAAIEQSLRISTDLKRAHAVQFQITTAQPFLPQLTEYLRRRSAEVSRRGGAHPA